MEIVSEEALEEIGKYMTGNRESDEFLWSDEEGNSYLSYDEIRVAFPEPEDGEKKAKVYVLFCYQGQTIARMECEVSKALSIKGLLGSLAIQVNE